MTNGDTRTIAWRNDSEIAAISGGSSERLMRDVKSFVFEPSDDGVARLRFFLKMFVWGAFLVKFAWRFDPVIENGAEF